MADGPTVGADDGYDESQLPPEAPLNAYLAIAEHYYRQDRLDAAMKVIEDAFSTQGWPPGLWTAFYNELVCEYDARRASDPRKIDDLLSVELTRDAPGVLHSVLASEAASARDRVGKTLQVEFSKPVLVTVLLPDAPTEFIVGAYGYVSYKTDKAKICLPYTLFETDYLDEALEHEFTHIAVAELAGEDVPRWLDEGLATYVSRELRMRHARFVIETEAARGKMLRLSKIERTFNDSDLRKDAPQTVEAAYYLAASFVKFWADKSGIGSVRKALSEIGEGRDPERAIRLTAGISLGGLEEEWRHHLASL